MDKYIKLLKSSWLMALFCGIISCIISAFILLLWKGSQTMELSMSKSWIYSLFFIFMLFIVLLKTLNKKKLKGIAKQNSLIEKLQQYRKHYNQTLLLYSSLSLAFVCLACLMGFDKTSLVIPILLLVLVILNRPFRLKIEIELNLSEKEKNDLQYLRIEAKKK